ncbi:hypothetical protein C0992_006646 [Termitomyces sp. T32_za158]|nr:hypothetical protein C0992_006646 [Termitomyces sp. T32_za158]
MPPNAPRKMTAAKVPWPQVVISTVPPQSASSPPDFYSMFKRAVKRDSQQVILAVLQRPTFAQAAIGLCNTAKAFPGTPANCARYLGTIGWRFADQANFPLLDCRAAEDSLEVKAFSTFADAIVTIENNRREARRKEAEARAKDKDVVMLASLKLDLDAVLALLGQVDTALESLSSTTSEDDAARASLQKQRRAIEIAAQQQLHVLDISFQTFKFISECLSRLDAALGPSKVDQAGSLLNTLNVSFSSSNDDSDVKFQDPPQDNSESAVEISAAAAV